MEQPAYAIQSALIWLKFAEKDSSDQVEKAMLRIAIDELTFRLKERGEFYDC